MNESDFYNQWCTLYSDKLSPLALVATTAKISSEPALLFSAGYQAAIRATFPSIAFDGWLSFAVSEPETNAAYLKDDKLYGEKSWLAGSKFVGSLIVKVGRGKSAQYVQCATNDATTISHKPSPKFLSGMSQGSVKFIGAETNSVNADLVAQFSANEAFYLYQALLSALVANHNEAVPQAGQLKAQFNSEAFTTADLAALDQGVQQILKELETREITLGKHWQEDKRLFAMHSNRVQKNAAD